MPLDICTFLRSIQVHLLKVGKMHLPMMKTEIAQKERDCFLISRMVFSFRFPRAIKAFLIINFYQIGLFLSKKVSYKLLLKFKELFSLKFESLSF